MKTTNKNIVIASSKTADLLGLGPSDKLCETFLCDIYFLLILLGLSAKNLHYSNPFLKFIYDYYDLLNNNNNKNK